MSKKLELRISELENEVEYWHKLYKKQQSLAAPPAQWSKSDTTVAQAARDLVFNRWKDRDMDWMDKEMAQQAFTEGWVQSEASRNDNSPWVCECGARGTKGCLSRR